MPDAIAPLLLVITGPPCAGKSTVARRLRSELHLPLLAKDAFKETLFDSLGWSDRAWSKRLSAASYALLLHAADELLNAGRSCIVEGNFRWHENAAHFMSLQRSHPAASWLQIVCNAPVDVLQARLRERGAAQARHPGHVDSMTTQEIAAELREGITPLPLPGPVLMFDSSLGDDVVVALVRHVRDVIHIT